jgi:hypothetical protein
MAAPDGQDPPQVPHWMHISTRDSPGVRFFTSWRKVGGEFTDIVVVIGITPWNQIWQARKGAWF